MRKTDLARLLRGRPDGIFVAPFVLNLRGRRGVLPEGAVYIGGPVYRGPRRLPRSKWANPNPPRRNATREEREESIRKYEQHLHDSGLINDVHELRGRDLVCWRAPLPCHGDLLLRLANE